MEFKVVQKELELQSRGWIPTFHDVTTEVNAIVEASGVKNGTVCVASHHTTCSVMIQECSHDIDSFDLEYLQHDLLDIMRRMIPDFAEEHQYRHPGPIHAQYGRYVNEHGDTLAIYKLTHNIPLAMGDYQELERVLTSELGSKEDYAREFGDTPFGLLIRKIAKLDHEAAMQAFSAFINDQSLNQKQIAFVNKIINHIELNGYMENVSELTKPPFDKPISFIKLFDAKTRTALMETINQVRENAVQITAS